MRFMTRHSASQWMRRGALCALLLLGLMAMHALPMVMPGSMVPEHLTRMKMAVDPAESDVIPPMDRDQHIVGDKTRTSAWGRPGRQPLTVAARTRGTRAWESSAGQRRSR